MSISSRDRLGCVGGVVGSLLAGDSLPGVFGEDFLPLKSRPSLPPLPLAARLKESSWIHKHPKLVLTMSNRHKGFAVKIMCKEQVYILA